MHGSNTLQLDASIAAVLDITNIRHAEQVVITISADEAWQGTYELTLFNSRAKNSRQTIAGAVTVTDKDMLLTVEPVAQSIAAGSYWYEIYNTLTKRIEFMGDLKIER